MARLCCKVSAISSAIGKRVRFACFTKRTDAPTLIRCLMEALEYFGGLPQRVLTDRMKSVLVRQEDRKTFQWHAGFSDFMASLGVTPRVCKPYRYRWRSEQGVAA